VQDARRRHESWRTLRRSVYETVPDGPNGGARLSSGSTTNTLRWVNVPWFITLTLVLLLAVIIALTFVLLIVVVHVLADSVAGDTQRAAGAEGLAQPP
jgi:hypothetical protein